MSEDNKNVAGDSERTSILPQSELEAADQTEVLPTHASEAETAQMPPITQQESAHAFAGTPLESVAPSSADEHPQGEAVAACAATVEPASKKTSWGKRAAIAGAAAAILSVGFGAGIITHAAILGDGEDFYEQGYEDGVSATPTRTRTRSRTVETSRTRMEAQAAVSRGLVTASSRALVPGRAIQTAPARDLLRRAAEAPVAPAVAVRM